MRNRLGVIAAHPDDEVLGCGGTIARFVQEGGQVAVLLVGDGVSSRGDHSATIDLANLAVRNEAALRASEVLGCTSVQQLALPDNRLDEIALLDVVKKVEDFIEQHQPETVMTHHAGDVNIDHRVVHDAVIAACRPQPGFPVKELLFFEVPSSTEWRPPESERIFAPNMFVDISSTLKTKMDALQAYADELREFPHPRSFRAVEALACWRGASVGVDAAEAFVVGRKIV